MNLFNDHLNLSNNIYDNAKILKSVELNKQQELVNRNPTTKYYQTLAQNLQEQVQYLKRQLNEAASPPGPLDRSYQDPNTQQYTDVNGGPISGSPSGPNYNWPPNTGLGQGNGGLSDYFPEGLGPLNPPNPRDYAGGETNQQYKIDRARWKVAVNAYRGYSKDAWRREHERPRQQSIALADLERSLNPLNLIRRIIRHRNY